MENIAEIARVRSATTQSAHLPCMVLRRPTISYLIHEAYSKQCGNSLETEKQFSND